MNQFNENEPDGHIFFMLPSFRGGGMENKTIALAEKLAELGWIVNLIIINNHNPAYQPSSSVQVFDLNAKKISLALPNYLKFLKKNKPQQLISISGPLNIFAIIGKLITGYPKRLLVSERNHISSAARYWVKRGDAFRPFLARWLYPFADLVLCVSTSVRDDLVRVTGLKYSKVVVAPNIFDLENIRKLARTDRSLPSYLLGDKKVILSVGRLSRQKDHETLIKAFASVKTKMDAMLVILGEGPQKEELVKIARSTEFERDIHFGGFISNPFPIYQRADVFVLPSLYEGLPGVLIEALALGKTCVATDCPGGSGEILAGGQAGYLCPVSDPVTMAEMILRSFQNPIPEEVCLARAEEYSIEKNLKKILDLIT